MTRALLLAAVFAALTPATSLAARCPNILVVFDVSGSMGSTVTGTSQTRYQVGRDAVKALLAGNSANFRYGLEVFGTSASSGCGVSSCYYTPASCTSSPCTCESVLCDYNTAAAIGAVLDARQQEGSTPTATSINTARTRTDMTDSTRNRYIILITDGDPNCTGNTLGDTTTALTNAKNAGVKTYILGFAGGSAANLNQMAIAGGTQRNTTCDTGANKCYYDAATPSELNAALGAIVSAVGGELGGGGACDDTCYGGGCATGQICKNSACAANPCANVSCPAGTCVDGQCKLPCDPACASGTEYCDNGVCRPNVACAGDAGSGCLGRNQICVGGQCVEDWCNHPTNAISCASNAICIENACQVFSGGAGGGAGGGSGGAGGGTGSRDGGTGGGVNSGTGCCSGVPEAGSIFGLLIGVSTLAGLRRRSRR